MDSLEERPYAIIGQLGVFDVSHPVPGAVSDHRVHAKSQGDIEGIGRLRVDERQRPACGAGGGRIKTRLPVYPAGDDSVGKILSDLVFGDKREPLDVFGGPDGIDIHPRLIILPAIERDMFIGMPDGTDQTSFASFPLESGW